MNSTFRIRRNRGRARFVTLALMAGVAFFGLGGCGDDNGGAGTGPDLITVADLAGTWTASEYTLSSKSTPQISLDLISVGGAFMWVADAQGNFTGEVTIPPMAGGPATLTFEGSFQLIGQDTLLVTFNPDIPPLLTSGPVGFTLTGNTATITDDDESFDFDQDGNPEPAEVVGVLVRG